MGRELAATAVIGSAAIAEFGGIVYGCATVKGAPLELVILCGGLVVMLFTVLGGAKLWA